MPTSIFNTFSKSIQSDCLEYVGLFAIAALAGSPRFISYFPKSSQSGILLATTIFCGALSLYAPKEQNRSNLLRVTFYKAGLMAATMSCSLCLTKLFKNRVPLSFKGAFRSGTLQMTFVACNQLRKPSPLFFSRTSPRLNRAPLYPRNQRQEHAQRSMEMLYKVDLVSKMEKPNPLKLEELLKEVPVNQVFSLDHQTILHIIAMDGVAHWSIPLLAEKGADFNAQTWRDQNTPLLWAIADGRFDMAKALIQNAPESTDFNLQGLGNTALHLAIGKGYTNITADGDLVGVSCIELAQLLIPKTDLTTKDHWGNTPLHLACIRRNPEIIKALLDGGADPRTKNHADRIPLHLLSLTYEQACDFLKQATSPFLLDRELFNQSKDACKALLMVP